MSGYTQAIENMAYTIDQLSLRTLDPIMEQYGCTTPAEAQRYMSDSALAEWEEVERIAEVVCETYGVEYDDFMDQVALTLQANQLIKTIGGIN